MDAPGARPRLSLPHALGFAAVLALVAWMLIASLGKAWHAPDSDEGYYLYFESNVQQHGLRVFPELFRSWNANDIVSDILDRPNWWHPPPYRLGYIVVAAWWARLFGASIASLSWLSPIGWGQQMRPFADNSWWPTAFALASAVLLFGVAVFLVGTALRVAFSWGRKTVRWQLDDDMDRRAAAGRYVLDEQTAIQLCDLALSKVDAELAEIFVLFELEDLTSPEIAALLEIPLGTVASRLRRAREQFRLVVSRIELAMRAEITRSHRHRPTDGGRCRPFVLLKRQAQGLDLEITEIAEVFACNMRRVSA